MSPQNRTCRESISPLTFHFVSASGRCVNGTLQMIVLCCSVLYYIVLYEHGTYTIGFSQQNARVVNAKQTTSMSMNVNVLCNSVQEARLTQSNGASAMHFVVTTTRLPEDMICESTFSLKG